MKEITIKQPWASLIAYGHKTIETRMHERFRSLVGQRIAIHAGLSVDKKEPAAFWMAQPMVPPVPYPAGVVLCTCLVTDMERASNLHTDDDMDDFRRGAMCDVYRGLVMYHMADVELLKTPIPAKGKQGMWNIDI